MVGRWAVGVEFSHQMISMKQTDFIVQWQSSTDDGH